MQRQRDCSNENFVEEACQGDKDNFEGDTDFVMTWNVVNDGDENEARCLHLLDHLDEEEVEVELGPRHSQFWFGRAHGISFVAVAVVVAAFAATIRWRMMNERFFQRTVVDWQQDFYLLQAL